MTRVLALLVLGVLVLAPSARADAVLDWNQIAQTTILAPGPTSHASTLEFAMVHGAMYDAVNAIDRRHRPYLRIRPAPPWASQDAAAATAAFKVLVATYPAAATSLQASYDASMAKIPFGLAKARGIEAGEAAAAAMLAARAGDGRMAHGEPYPFPQGTTPGAWRVSPPLTAVDPAWWVGNVRPFLIPSARWFGTDGPNDLRSRAYARDFAEVKEIGALASTTRTADQTFAAIFWQAPPIALYGSFLRDLSARHALSTAENARLFGSVGLAVADAAIACWADKYKWRFWRPIDAIHLADTDGNRRTTADPSWKPLFDPSTPTSPPLATPSFPDHPSGHGCASSAATHAVARFFGTDRVPITVTSGRYPGQPRSFARLSDMLREIVDARVWAGVHFRTADVQGAQLGEKVVRWQRWFAF